MTRRGQLVLLAAAALAVALVPMALAYLQLGYDHDVHSATVDDQILSDTERTLQRALDDAAAPIPAQYDWSRRTAAVTAVRSRLNGTLATLDTSRLAAGTVLQVSYDRSRAKAWAGTQCPGGPARQFGACRADRAVVVQERAGQTHVLAVAVEIRVTTPRGDRRAVSVVRTIGNSY